MTQLLYGLAAAALSGAGLFAIFFNRTLLGRIIAINVAASGVFTMLIATAPVDAQGRPDPVPQALVLTGIVIAISITAYALLLLRRLNHETGDEDLGDGES